MARVVGQIIHRPGRVTIIWSEGGASFEPYHLTGAALETFYDTARRARYALAGAVASGSDDAAVELATLGHQLHRLLFQLDAPSPAAQAAFAWWQELQAKDAVTSLELVSDRPGCVPWNLIYDQAPDAEALRAGPQSPAWQHFWGARFVLGVGRRVSPHRAFPYFDNPATLIVLDPAVEREWNDSQRQQLPHFVSEHGGNLVRSWHEAETNIRKQAPDVLIFLGRVVRGQLLVDNQAMGLRELRQTITSAEAGNPEPLILLLGAGEPDAAASWECFLGAATSELSSVVAPEVPVPASKNLRVSLGWMTLFLSATNDVGTALKQARPGLGVAGLAYSAFCPPYPRVLEPGKEPDHDLPRPVPIDLPAQPYRPLTPFDREDKALFIGREDETVRFARLLDDAGTRGILLHGHGGAGKASLLRAGVLPYLEDEAIGYLALRDRSETDQAVPERDRPTLALRASRDLAGQLAEALCAFAAQPLTYGTPAGQSVTVDLPALLARHMPAGVKPRASSEAIQASAPAAMTANAPTPEAPGSSERSGTSSVQLYDALLEDTGALGRLLGDLTAQLPWELLIIIEQGEDVLFEGGSAEEQRRRDAGLAMLAALGSSPARCKVVVSLRTEMFGQFCEAFAAGKDRSAWRDVYLAPLDAKTLTEALLLPTSIEPPPSANVAPHTRYQFTFDRGVVEKIVEDAEATARDQHTSAQALAQAACAVLVERIHDKKEALIKLGHLRDLRSAKRGPIDRALDRHLDHTLTKLPISRVAQRSLRHLLGQLHERHEDGTITRPLFAVRDLAQHWRGGDTLENAVNAAADANLLEVQQLLVGGQRRLFVGLAQDALAGWAVHQEAAAERRKYARARVIDACFILVPLIALAAAVTYYIMNSQIRDQETRFKEVIAKEIVPEMEELRPLAKQAPIRLYAGALAQADQAIKAGNLLRARQHLLSQQPFAGLKDPGLDRRDFAWHYLWRQANPERQTLLHGDQDHAPVVHAVAASPDGNLLATAGADGTIQLWNLKNQGEVAAFLSGSKGPVFAVAFAPDSKTLASGGQDGNVRIWDVKVGLDEPMRIDQPSKTLAGHTGPVRSLAFGKDNALLTGSEDKTVIVWDVAAGKAKTTLKEHTDSVDALAVAPDGKTFASGGGDQGLIIWDLDGAKKVSGTKVAGRRIQGLAFASDGALLASATNEAQAGGDVGMIRVWDAATGKEVGPGVSCGIGAFGVAFKPNSNIVVAAGKDHVVRAWDARTGKEQIALPGHFGWVRAAVFTPDGATLATSSYDNTVKLWNWSNTGDVLTHGDWVQALALSSDDQLLASGGRDGVVKVWRTATGELATEIKGHPGPITALTFLPDDKERKLAVGSLSDDGAGSVKLWELVQALGKLHAKEGPTFKGHAKSVQCLAFARNKTLASGSSDGTVILWDVAKGEPRHKLEADGSVLSLSFSPSGARLATGDSKGKVRLWDTATGALYTRGKTKEVGAHANEIRALVFLGEDFDFLSAGSDHAVKQWSWKEDKNPGAGLVARSHSQPVSSLVQLGGGAFASASWDGTVKLWDLRDASVGQECFTLVGHNGPVRALAAASNRQLLASGGHDGTIRLWRASAPLGK